MTKARTLADNFAADINGISPGTGITGGGTSGTVTVTNSMATAIDAKGDLVVGTGADTFSRLAVASTAGYLLSVDSAEATGLKWAAPSAGALTKITTATLGSSSSSWDIENVFSSTYENYLVRLLIKAGNGGNINLRWLTSGGVYTSAAYYQNYFRINNASLSGSDVGDTQHFLSECADTGGGNDNFAIGELQIGRVGISSANCGNLMSRMVGGNAAANVFNGNRIFAGSAITITGFRLLTTASSITANSVVTVYGLEK